MHLHSFYQTSKHTPSRKNYKGKKGKYNERKEKVQKNTSLDTPNRLDVRVVETIQPKKVEIQEDFLEEPSSFRTRNKSSKYKGKKKFNKAEPRSRSVKDRAEESKYQRRRDTKRQTKEDEDEEENTAIQSNLPTSNRKSSVTFEFSNSKESLSSRKRTRASRMGQTDPHYSKKGESGNVPPKSEAQKEFDREWAQDLPQELTKDEKEYLLSLEDQAERNRELSRMTESAEFSTSGRHGFVAGLRHRKSHLKNKLRQTKSTRYSGRNNKLDEEHYKKFNESRKVNTARVTESERDTPSKKGYESYGRHQGTSIEICNKIRERGEIAKQKSSKNHKSTPKMKMCSTPNNKVSNSPLPFTVLSNDERLSEVANEESIAPLEEAQDMSIEIEPKHEIVYTPSELFKQHKEKVESEEKRLDIVEKVQTQHKDVSVPLVTEIQQKPLRDSSHDVMPQNTSTLVANLTPKPMKSFPKVIEEIKVQIGNLRSPAKITNKMILPTEEPSLHLLTESGSEFKTPLPKRTKSAAKHETNEKAKEIISTFPMRIDIKDRPKEYDDIILPTKLQLVFDFFTELDNAINNCKRRGKIPILANLKPYVEQSTNRSFDIEHFQKVLYVAPELYYYSWQPAKGGNSHDLRIEVPTNIEEILSKIHKKGTTVEIRHDPLSEAMTNFLTNKRKIVVRTRLILYMENLHKHYLNQNSLSAADFNAVKGWHPGFDIESVMDLPKKSLKNLPKNKKSETISEFLKNKNIKNTLLKRAAENMSKKEDPSAEMLPDSQSTMPSSIMFNSIEKRSPAKINNASISPNFYKRIETKEKMYKEEREILEYESKQTETKRKQELMLKIAQAVKSVFSVKSKVNTLFLNQVLKFLNDSQRGSFYSKKELISTLKEISEIVPEWITLKHHDRGFLVKI